MKIVYIKLSALFYFKDLLKYDLKNNNIDIILHC